jgi:pimeloyl-ACP methyl ester carboxylesterase
MDLLTTSDGVAIAYHTFWPTTAAPDLPPVVLQHGFAADTQMNWIYPGVVDALLAAGRQVISVDARGHGESDKPHDPAFYGEGRMAQDLIELFGVLGLAQLDLVGYSMGGVISLVTATQCHIIRRMVVGGIGAGIAELGGVDTRHLDTSALAAALRAVDVQSITDPVARSFRLFAESTGADCLALAAQAERVQNTAIPLAQITATTMVLVGEADPLAARPEVLAAAIRGAVLKVIPGDHLGAVSDPQFAPAIVQFLAG